MANNTLLGAIDLQYSGGGVVADGPDNLPFDPSAEGGKLYVDQPKRGDFVITPPPGGGGIITLPTDTGVTYFPGGPSGGGGAAPDLQEDKPEENSRDYPGGALPYEGPSRKTIIVLGIGGLLLAYLLLRKK